MQYLDYYIHYNDNSPEIFRSLFLPIRDNLQKFGLSRWTLSRSWQNGPHFKLRLALPIDGTVRQKLLETAQDYVSVRPSPALDLSSYAKLQKKLAEIEGISIDPNFIRENNSIHTESIDASSLYRNYESPEQWQSLFTGEGQLSRALIALRRPDLPTLDLGFILLILLGSIYSPVPAEADGFDEYNGYLSYHSNFTFWHQSLTAEQQNMILKDFESRQSTHEERFDKIFQELLEGRVHEPSIAAITSFLSEAFDQAFTMANSGLIHARSPYPFESVTPYEELPAFHQQHFYTRDGRPFAFSHQFSAYRWVLNIVYRSLPLVGMSPLDRQFMNYFIFDFQNKRRGAINRLRSLIQHSN